MTAPRDQPRRSRPERRRLLLAQARHLFASQGFAATDLADVAAAAGVSVAVLRRTYPDRAELFADLLADLLDNTLRAWRQETAELSDPHARLHALAERFLAALRGEAVTLRAVARAVADCPDEVAVGVRTCCQEWEEFLAGLIAQGQQAGFFRRSLDPRVAAWQLMHAALGCALSRALGVGLHGQPGYAAQAIECALHCLLKTDV